MLEHLRAERKPSPWRDMLIVRHERESIPTSLPGRRPDAGHELPDNARSDSLRVVAAISHL